MVVLLVTVVVEVVLVVLDCTQSDNIVKLGVRGRESQSIFTRRISKTSNAMNFEYVSGLYIGILHTLQSNVL